MTLSHALWVAYVLAIGTINGGLWWRLRGGALTALFGWDPGTGGMRALAGVFIAINPAATGEMWWFLLAPALWAGWSIAGWGAFQGMGRSTVGHKNPLERVLARFLAPVPMCLVGMALEGAYCLALPGVAAGWVTARWYAGLGVMLAGLGFAPIYYFAQSRVSVPDLGKFERGGSELAEVLVGAWVGFVLAAVALGFAP